MIGAIGLLLAAMVQAPAASACTSNLAVAVAVSVDDIGRDTDRFLDKCVTVGGAMTSIALYGSVEGLYRVHRYDAEGEPDPEALRLNRVGLYSPDNAIRALPADGDGLPHLRVIGTVDTCERIYDRAMAWAGPDDLIMLTGYCHYHGGAVIDVVSFEVDRTRRYRRMTGEEARERYGDLVVAPPGWSKLPELQAFRDAFRRAVAADNRDRLAQLHDMQSPPTEQETEILERLTGADSPFAALRATARIPSAIFIDRSDMLAAAKGVPPELPYGTICFCKTEDCDGKWPIAGNDADNAPQRPYACTRVAWSEDGSGQLETSFSSREHGWLAEPSSD